MRICYLSLDYPSLIGGGGVGTFTQAIARSLASQGHSVCVVAIGNNRERRRDGEIEVIRFIPGRIHRILMKLPVIWALARSVRELERSWHGWQAVRALHAEKHFDIVEITESGGLFVALLMRSTTVIGRLHGEGYTFYKYAPEGLLTSDVRCCRWFQRLSLRRAQLLLSPSKSHSQEISTELGYPHPPIEVIPNAVELTMLRFQSKYCIAAPDKDGKPLVLFVGRLDEVKGVPLLLSAAREVIDAVPEAQFMLIGPRHHTLSHSTLERLISNLHLTSNVRILGHIPRVQLSAWYQQASLCVVPSYYETFGISALEAMSFGCPVVATRAGALPELIDDQQTGLLVAPGDRSQLSQAILRLLRDRELRQWIGANGRARVASLFNIADVVQANIALYNSARASTTKLCKIV